MNVLNVKALVGAFNQEKALVGAFSVIVTPQTFISSSISNFIEAKHIRCFMQELVKQYSQRCNYALCVPSEV